jgi:hypothetical protein
MERNILSGTGFPELSTIPATPHNFITPLYLC